MKGVCWINGKDAYTNFGMIFGEGSLDALKAFPPLKKYITNSSALEDGIRVVLSTPKVDHRDVQLNLSMYANSREDFDNKRNALWNELKNGEITLSTIYQPNVIYHLRYLSCNQYTEFNGKLAKFVLRVLEPNPEDRT